VLNGGPSGDGDTNTIAGDDLSQESWSTKSKGYNLCYSLNVFYERGKLSGQGRRWCNQETDKRRKRMSSRM
jgi:hypothetical protein